MKRKLGPLICLLCACLLAAGIGAASEETFTILIYLCGTDLESEGYSASMDLIEMAEAGLTGEGPVYVVVETGGTMEWGFDWIEPEANERWLVVEDDLEYLDTLERRDMGNPQTLQDFIEFGVQSYPADRYGLILWNHGLGSTFGVCFDEYTDEGLTTGDLYHAISDASETLGGLRLDFVAFDACLMANFELAEYLSDYVDYMVASEELVPDLGLDYKSFLRQLNRDPSMSTEALCRAIVDSFMSACLAEDPDDYMTMSVLDLREMAALTAEVERISDSLQSALNSGQLQTISRSRHNMRSFGDGYGDVSTDLVDLLQYVEVFSAVTGADTEAFRQAFSKVVVYSRYTEHNLENVSGLSILAPNKTGANFYNYAAQYDPLDRYPAYTAYISGYTELVNDGSHVFSPGRPAVAQASDAVGAFLRQEEESEAGGSGFSYFYGLLADREEDAGAQPGDQGEAAESASSFDEGAAFGADGLLAYTLTLSAEDMAHLSYVESNLMIDISDDQLEMYIDLGYLQNTTINWDTGVVYSLFDGSWPMLEDQLVYMTDQTVTARSRRSLIDVTVNGEESYLLVIFDEDRPGGEVVGYTEGYNENGLPVRGYRKLEVGDVIVPVYYIYTYDDAGEEDFLPFEGDPIEYTGAPLSFSYYDLIGEEMDFVYAFCLNDIFGDYQFSDFVAFSM